MNSKKIAYVAARNMEFLDRELQWSFFKKNEKKNKNRFEDYLKYLSRGIACEYNDKQYAFVIHTIGLNPDTYLWEAPVPYPQDGKVYTWDEATQSWVEVPQG